jgi:hypothetical protein
LLLSFGPWFHWSCPRRVIQLEWFVWETPTRHPQILFSKILQYRIENDLLRDVGHPVSSKTFVESIACYLLQDLRVCLEDINWRVLHTHTFLKFLRKVNSSLGHQVIDRKVFPANRVSFSCQSGCQASRRQTRCVLPGKLFVKSPWRRETMAWHFREEYLICSGRGRMSCYLRRVKKHQRSQKWVILKTTNEVILDKRLSFLLTLQCNWLTSPLR